MKTRQLILCAMFAALTAIGSLIKIPVPDSTLLFTLQTFFVFMAGLMLEPKYALFSQIVYAAMGLIGVPVFSTGGGIGYILRPSFGFIIGFCLCALLISLLVRKNLLGLISRKTNKLKLSAKIVIFMILAILVMYSVGVPYMYIIFNIYLDEPRSIEQIIFVDSAVFILLDFIKFAVAVPVCATVLQRLKSLHPG